MKSWGHESSAASNLRRRCDLRARIRARAPTSAARASSCVLPLVSLSSARGRRERVRSPAPATGRESTSARSVMDALRGSAVERRRAVGGRTRGMWESLRVECYHIFKVQNPNSTTSHVCAGQKSTEISRQCSRRRSGGKLSARLSASLVVP